MKSKGRPRANSAPSVAALSTRYHGNNNILIQYPQILNNLGPSGHQRGPLPNGLLSVPSSGFPPRGSHLYLGGARGSYLFLGGVRGSYLSVSGTRRLHQRRGTLGNALSISQEQKENIELRCCRINVLLVTMQLCLGAMITALAFYMQTLTSSLRIRECPYWAGVPLLFAGVAGVYYCATEFSLLSTSKKSIAIKVTCFVLSTCGVFLCMVASVFPGFLGNKIASLDQCKMSAPGPATCRCTSSTNSSTVYSFDNIESCEILIASVKDYLILQCSLNCIASGVCFWLVTLLWKSKYQQEMYPGLRFPFYQSSNLHSCYSGETAQATSTPKEEGYTHPPSPIIGVPPHKKRYVIQHRPNVV